MINFIIISMECTTLVFDNVHFYHLVCIHYIVCLRFWENNLFYMVLHGKFVKSFLKMIDTYKLLHQIGYTIIIR